MAEKYYWLKLKRDFFKRHDIRIIEAMPNGKDYILFYLKLLCESVDHNGNLRFNELIPYSDEMLATITDTNIDIVRTAIKIFTELHMMEILDDGTYFMSEVEKMLGFETTWAEKKRAYREKMKNEDNVLDMSSICPQPVLTMSDKSKSKNKSIEKEIDKEIDIDTYKSPTCQEIIDAFNEICVSFPKVMTLSEARKKAIKARLKTYSHAEILAVFQLAEESDFLKGGNNRDWSANFDWIMKDSNFAKILDGNYVNKQKQITVTKYSVPPSDYIVDQINGVPYEGKKASKDLIDEVKKLQANYKIGES